MPTRRSAASQVSSTPVKKQKTGEGDAKAAAPSPGRLQVPVVGGSVVHIGHGLLKLIPKEITGWWNRDFMTKWVSA